MSPAAQKVREIFVQAVKLAPQQWDAYLAQVCGDDGPLHGRVQQLLAAHQKAGSFLAAPAVDVNLTAEMSINERPGTVIGPYKLLEQIGEGGFGVVFRAEQQQPVRRQVALKVIKPGMDTRQVIARFEAERQALALMDHPNIARVLDAGETESRLPYFVMELIHGVPITRYADEHQLTTRERLELFGPVCQAVQHAHQKGIIHRDLKPSNVLITVPDPPSPPLAKGGIEGSASPPLGKGGMGGWSRSSTSASPRRPGSSSPTRRC
jgi:serine/threonine protein kinase